MEGYEGDRCELMVTDECDPDPCQNGGTCIVRHSCCILYNIIQCSKQRANSEILSFNKCLPMLSEA